MINKICSVFVLCAFLYSGTAQGREFLSYELDAGTLAIKTSDVTLLINPINSSSVEVVVDNAHSQRFPSFALTESIIASKSKPNFDMSESASHVLASLAGLTVYIDKTTAQLSFYKNNVLLLKEESGYFFTHTTHGFRFSLSADEKIIGGGQRLLGMNRRGHEFPLYNRAHYGYEGESNQMYFGLPAIMSDRQYALVFDNSATGNMDIGHDNPEVMQFDAVSGRASYIVFTGDGYPSLIEQFTEATGRQPLLPRWALGNFASRFGYRNQAQVEDVVQRFKQAQIPLDGVILDLYWFGPDIKGHMGNLAWDRVNFPDPDKMIERLQNDGVKTLLITEPFVLTTSKRWDDAVKNNALATDVGGKPKRFNFYFGNTGLVDVFSKDGQDWFKGIYRDLADQNVAGWWGDLGEPEVHPYDLIHHFNDQTYTAEELHNVYGHQWAKLVFEQAVASQPDERPFVLMRSGFVGSQRYGMVPWTGDVSRTWNGLASQIELSLQMSMLGLGYTHSDLGGFAGGETFDKEMYIRWLQFGVFQPIYRPHAQENIAPEVVFHDQETQDIVSQYIKLRYQLTPYLYTMMYQNSKTGMPLMRPMMFEKGAPSEWFDIDDQYFWGDAFLVKPVVTPKQEKVNVILPEGQWYDFWTKRKYPGGQTLGVSTELSHLPVFVRAGSVIPTIETVQSLDDYDGKHLYLEYYMANQSQKQFVMYEDDGKDPNALSKERYQSIEFEHRISAAKDEFIFHVNGHYPGAPKQRCITLSVLGWKGQVNAHSVSLTDRTLGKNSLTCKTSSTYDKDAQTLKVTFPIEVSQSVTVH